MDGIELCVPANVDYLMVVRLASAGAATLAGYNVDEVEDIKSAVCEACYFLINQPHSYARLSIRLFGPGLNVRIQGEGERVPVAIGEPDHEVARIVLSSMMSIKTFDGDELGISVIELFKA